MNIHFVVPRPASFPSGGNRYNAALIRALQQTGVAVTHEADLEYDAGAGQKVIYDSIYLKHLREIPLPPGSCLLVHHLDSLYPPSNPLFMHTEKPVLDRFYGLVATSAFTREWLVTRGYPGERILALEPACPVQKVPRKHFSSKVRALCVANLIPRKGILDFLEALAAEAIPPFFEIRIAGSDQADPAYAGHCLELIRSHPLLKKTVQYKGIQDHAGIRLLMKSSNLFVSASHMETYGMAIQEAAAAGLPLIALNRGNLCHHIAEGINGFCCATMDEIITRFAELATRDQDFLNLQKRAYAFQPGYIETWKEQAESLTRWLFRHSVS